MRNIITIGDRNTAPVPSFGKLEAGTLFRYLAPWNAENVYMKVEGYRDAGDIEGNTVHLNTGKLYATLPDQAVVPLMGYKIEISNPV